MARTIIATALALGLAAQAQAGVLKQGEVVCRNARALEQLQTAEAAGDQATIDWLLDGAACFKVPADTPVARVEAGSNGNAAFRTTERRRNLTVWANEKSAPTDA